MFKRIATAVVGIGLVAGAAAMAQTPQPTTYVAPAGVQFQINLYPISKFRGIPVVLKENTPRMRLPINAESIQLTRGVWELCPDYNYYGRCVRVNETRVGIPVALIVRSARLVGDSGPLFNETPILRAGPDVPVDRGGEVIEARPTPAPVVAPKVEEGGAPGENTSLAGRDVEMFPAPARNGLRVLACAQTPGTSSPRCAQATADGFCAERGYRDSGWREVEVVSGRAYLVNVLCKKAEDNSGARSSSPFSLFKN